MERNKMGIDLKKLRRVIKEYINKELLQESLSDILFHFTYLEKLDDIIKTDKFQLTPAFTSTGIEQDLSKGRYYYASFSRIKWGGYHRAKAAESIAVANIKFDGRKLGYNYKGYPIEYWSGMIDRENNPSNEWLRNVENEDRLVSNESVINNIKKYIISIHIYIPPDNAKQYKEEISTIHNYGKDVDIYWYTDFDAYRLMDTRKGTQNFFELPALKKLQYKDLESPYDFKTLSAIIELWNKDSRDNLSKKAKEILKDLRWGVNDMAITINNILHNKRSQPDKAIRKYIDKYINVLKQAKVRSTEDFLKLIQKKFKN